MVFLSFLLSKNVITNVLFSFLRIKYGELEDQLGEEERCRAVYELAVSQPLLDIPELLWKAYIGYYYKKNVKTITNFKKKKKKKNLKKKKKKKKILSIIQETFQDVLIYMNDFLKELLMLKFGLVMLKWLLPLFQMIKKTIQIQLNKSKKHEISLKELKKP